MPAVPHCRTGPDRACEGQPGLIRRAHVHPHLHLLPAHIGEGRAGSCLGLLLAAAAAAAWGLRHCTLSSRARSPLASLLSNLLHMMGLAARPGMMELAARPGMMELAARPGMMELAGRPGMQLPSDATAQQGDLP
jgi:hypothetical protein